MTNSKKKSRDALTQAYDELKSANARSAKTETSMGGLSYEDLLQAVVADMQASRLADDPRPCTLERLKEFVTRETFSRLGQTWMNAQEEAPLSADILKSLRADDKPPNLADDIPTLLALTMLALEDQPFDQRVLQAMVDVEYDPTGKPNRKKNVIISEELGCSIEEVENAKKRIKRRALSILNFYRRYHDQR